MRVPLAVLVRSLPVWAFVASLTAPAASQGTPQNLVGGAGPAPFVQQQVWCTPAAPPLCPLPYPPPPAPFAGGSAYDSFASVLWDTTGAMLIGVSPLSVPPCAPVCPPVPVPGLPPNALLCGLAFDDFSRTLIAIDSTPAIRAYAVPPVGCPMPAFQCPLVGLIPPNLQPGGLAFSEKNQLLYFSASNFLGGAPATLVFATRAPANPCVPLCVFPLPNCPAGPPLGPITGLAFDDCQDQLYLTDGTTTMRLTLNIAASPCTITAVQCCAQALAGPYYGLDVEASHPRAVGVACLGAPCPACPAMVLASQGDPTVGNPLFAVTLNGAPAASVAALVLNSPGCTAGVPLGCGLVYPPLAGLLALPGVPTVGAGCNATATWPIRIPVNYWFCGLAMCMQAAIGCPGGGLGLTNALNVTFTDS